MLTLQTHHVGGELERLIEKLKLKEQVRLTGRKSNDQVRREMLDYRAGGEA